MLTACHDELPNPHKNCLREMLNTMICNDQDVKRLNTQLRNLELELKEELRKIEKANEKCGEAQPKLGKKRLCDPDEDLSEFTKRIINLDEVKHFYSKRSEEIRKRRDSIIMYGRQCLQAYNEEKCKFKSFHENTVDYIKRTATLSQDQAVITRCERDICEMHKRFVREVANLKHCEAQLQPFFKLLKDSDPNLYCECCCLKDYEWMPQGKNMESVDATGKEFKEKMGKTLVSAFAQLHLHMPQDMYGFIAGYLMNVERNEHEVKEKLDLFQDHEVVETKELPDPTYRCDTECPKK
ncbi:uncharacterized protein [Drosophila virilis]|uniref:Uncharacterized protein n=1 Tax=Drosophila virilis TaxID=7244 RepID=B4LZK4_DROVI|nr:uncharacterized protein LOC6630140 [Drosophila virilis]EDW67143.1 uncharacterized protein Dvir_GJ23998 [Drosophila virilis]